MLVHTSQQDASCTASLHHSQGTPQAPALQHTDPVRVQRSGAPVRRLGVGQLPLVPVPLLLLRLAPLCVRVFPHDARRRPLLPAGGAPARPRGDGVPVPWWPPASRREGPRPRPRRVHVDEDDGLLARHHAALPRHADGSQQVVAWKQERLHVEDVRRP